MTDDLRARILAVLREHQPPTHTDSQGLPPDEFECCADAVLAVLGPAQEQTVRAKVAAEIRSYAAAMLCASEPTWYGGMADAAELAAGADPQEMHRRNAEAGKIRRGWR